MMREENRNARETSQVSPTNLTRETGFLSPDEALYHFGASFKDFGKHIFAFELMGIDKNVILN